MTLSTLVLGLLLNKLLCTDLEKTALWKEHWSQSLLEFWPWYFWLLLAGPRVWPSASFPEHSQTIKEEG